MPPTVSTWYRAGEETLVEYFQKTSLNGFGLLYYIRRRKYQRLLWFMFILMGIVSATYILLVTLLYFLQDPTVTSLNTQHFPIWTLPHPAVAICSVNKLSRQAVEAYAKELSARSQRHDDSLYWLQKIHLYSGYFDSDSVDLDAANDFQSELDELQGATPYNASKILRKLAPSCNELLIKCRWAGQPKECEELFQLHATASGHCCIFNYQRGAEHENAFSLKYPSNTGIENGLIVLLNTSIGDYFYTERSTSGFTLQIFHANNFPDATTGGLQEVFISRGDNTEVQLGIVTQEATTEARDYAVQKRRCYFIDEHTTKYGSAYSQSECLTKCKIQSVLSLCGCIPYYTLADYFPGSNGSVAYCTLAHMECVDRYRVAWNNYRPAEQQMFLHLQEEMENTLSCEDCLPLCSYTRYFYSKRKSKLAETQYLAQTRKFLTNSTKVSFDISLVKVYFPTPHATQYRKYVLYNWYQILSNIGGVIGICMGCSFISGFEIVYFFGFRFFENFYKFRKTTTKR